MILLAVSLVIATLVTTTSPAFATATDCTTTKLAVGHCYAITQWAGLARSPYVGGHITLNSDLHEPGPSSATHVYHTSNEMWVGLDSQHYIEAGTRDGYVYAPGTHCGIGECQVWSYENGSGASQTCINGGCGAYILFWADTTYDQSTGRVIQYIHVVSFTSPSSSTEYIDILYDWNGSGHWNVNFTGTKSFSAISTVEDHWQRPDDISWGGEVYAPASNGYCADLTTDTAGIWSTTDNRNYSITWDPNTSANTQVSPGFATYASATPNGYWSWEVNAPC